MQMKCLCRKFSGKIYFKLNNQVANLQRLVAQPWGALLRIGYLPSKNGRVGAALNQRERVLYHVTSLGFKTQVQFPEKIKNRCAV